MRILKALAAVLAGTLLLALPAVAMPQDPQDPNCPEAGDTADDTTDQAGETNSGDTLDGSGGTTGESGETAEDQATFEECAPEDDQGQQEHNQLQSLLESLLGPLG